MFCMNNNFLANYSTETFFHKFHKAFYKNTALKLMKKCYCFSKFFRNKLKPVL